MGGYFGVFLPLGACIYQSHAKIRKKQVTIREEQESGKLRNKWGQAQHSKVLESWRTTMDECKKQETKLAWRCPCGCEGAFHAAEAIAQ